MNRIMLLLALVFSATSLAWGGDVIVFPSKNGAVTFSHKRHTDLLRECKNCHDKAPGKITNFGKDYAHKTCKGCHEVRVSGPTKCNHCHRK